jgi:hypothetical protein
MMRAQKETVGLNRGLAGREITGLGANPVKDTRPTLASQGVDKNLAHQARTLGALTDAQFEKAVAAARDAVHVTVKAALKTISTEEAAERRQCVGSPHQSPDGIRLDTDAVPRNGLLDRDDARGWQGG